MLAGDDPQSLVGAVLNRRWRIVGVRGEGGVGVVYEVTGLHGEGGRAVKLLRQEFCDDPVTIQRFLEEADASARIEHPNVVKVFEAARAEDATPYLVMELLSGQSLAVLMNRGRLPVALAVAVAEGVLSALAAAHQSGVVHRDLKPDNVFVNQDVAGATLVKVLDFGVARVMDAAGGMARKTRTGMLLGTPGYMSPEQIRNVKTADARSDLWSAGVLLYEMLVGELAFDAENDFARITRVLAGEATPIEQVAPQYAHFGPFFRRALAEDPQRRFQSALEMHEALRSVAQGGPLPAVTPTVPNAASPAEPVTVRHPGPFGGTDTAVSAGVDRALPATFQPSAPLVSMVPLPRVGVAVHWVVLWIAVALLMGLTIGYLLGAGGIG